MKLKCSVCGMKFMPIKERTYLVQENLIGIAALANAPKIHDAIDCPRCGCQKLLQIRIPVFERNEEREEERNENESCT